MPEVSEVVDFSDYTYEVYEQEWPLNFGEQEIGTFYYWAGGKKTYVRFHKYSPQNFDARLSDLCFYDKRMDALEQTDDWKRNGSETYKRHQQLQTAAFPLALSLFM